AGARGTRCSLAARAILATSRRIRFCPVNGFSHIATGAERASVPGGTHAIREGRKASRVCQRKRNGGSVRVGRYFPIVTTQNLLGWIQTGIQKSGESKLM